MKIECYPLHDSANEAARVLNRKALIFGMNEGYGILDTHDKTDWLRAEIAKYECGNLLAIRWR
jgi:hypothetical protein|nr:MAG TPA: hypothetical protein [Caudoviricetes sp.]